MNRSEAAWFLTTIAAPFQGEPFTDEAREVWFNSTLEQVGFDEGMEIAELLVGSEEFRPTPAVFNRELRNHRRQAAIADAGRPALEAAKLPSTHPAAEVIAELRDKLSRGPRDHWHGGPNPCPVCGGMGKPSLRHQKADLPKSWCSRCGSMSMPYTAGMGANPQPVEPMVSLPALKKAK